MDATRRTRVERETACAFRSAALGRERVALLPSGPLSYFEQGTGPVLVFAHGWLTNANLWRKVVPRLAASFRCLVLDLPLGSHLTAHAASADLTPTGIATAVNELLDQLAVRTATFVGNDSGGAYLQVAASQRPERVAQLVLSSSETPYDAWPHPAFTPLRRAAKSPDALGQFLEPLRDPSRRMRPEAYGLLAKHGLEPDVSDSYALPALHDEGVRRDLCQVISSVSQADVQRAAARLIEGWTGTAHFFWPTDDQFFPLENVRRYAADLPRAHVALIDDAYALTPEDQPERLATLIAHAVIEPRA